MVSGCLADICLLPRRETLPPLEIWCTGRPSHGNPGLAKRPEVIVVGDAIAEVVAHCGPALAIARTRYAFLRRGHGFSQYLKCLNRDPPVRVHVIRNIEIERINFGPRHEGCEANRAGTLDVERL